MKPNALEQASRSVLPLAVASLLAVAVQGGCGATCERIEEDRERFLSRKAKNTDTHLEVLVPFAAAERLLEPELAAVKPIALDVPGLGKVGDYFGELSVAPRRLRLLAAAADHIGFHLDFEVRSDGKRAFEMFLETEVRPEVDPKAGRLVIGFTKEALEKARPGITKDAKKDLGGLIHARIPAAARLFIPRSVVDAAAGTAVDALLRGFTDKAKERMLPRLAELSRMELTLPDVPLAKVAFSSSKDRILRISMVTSLPVRRGLEESKEVTPPPSDRLITVRASGSTLAELANWAIAKGLLPDRYDSKGKAKKDGELRPGLDWVAGEARPMKVILWDLEKPCMRITMAAKPRARIVDERLEIDAVDQKTEDVEASAFTKVGVWFYLLWKDALKLDRKTSSHIGFTVAGRRMEAVVERAEFQGDALVMEIGLSTP